MDAGTRAMQGAIAGSFSIPSIQTKGQPTKTWSTLADHNNLMAQHL